MKIIISPDSFKESLDAKKAAQAIENGFKRAYQKPVETILIPLADGGEGSLEVLQSSFKTSPIKCMSLDPYKRKIETTIGYNHERQIAIIESASCLGLNLIPLDKRNPELVSSYGLGILIKEAIKLKAKTIYITLGGSATNDGGLGMLRSLGASFKNKDNQEVKDDIRLTSTITSVNFSLVDKLLKDIEIIVVSDVLNPFIGPKGATYTFGPQKGATKNQLINLESQLTHFNKLLKKTYNIDLSNLPKTGAAGGLGGALYLCHGNLESGIDLILKTTNYESYLNDCDLIITGEGSIDKQSIDGKTICGVATLAKKYKVPVIALCGRVDYDLSKLEDLGLTAAFSIVNEAKDLKQALIQGYQALESTAYNLGKIYNSLNI